MSILQKQPFFYISVVDTSRSCLRIVNLSPALQNWICKNNIKYKWGDVYRG